MKGKDKEVLKTSEAVPGDATWVAKEPNKPAAKKSRKGKERSVDPEDAASIGDEADEDNDAAWLRKRQKALVDQDGIDEMPEAQVRIAWLSS